MGIPAKIWWIPLDVSTEINLEIRPKGELLEEFYTWILHEYL